MNYGNYCKFVSVNCNYIKILVLNLLFSVLIIIICSIKYLATTAF